MRRDAAAVAHLFPFDGHRGAHTSGAQDAQDGAAIPAVGRRRLSPAADGERGFSTDGQEALETPDTLPTPTCHMPAASNLRSPNSSEGGRNRTFNLWIKSPLLCLIELRPHYSGGVTRGN